jgi:hypothetical protein
MDVNLLKTESALDGFHDGSWVGHNLPSEPFSKTLGFSESSQRDGETKFPACTTSPPKTFITED